MPKARKVIKINKKKGCSLRGSARPEGNSVTVRYAGGEIAVDLCQGRPAEGAKGKG
jgi:hypothetical protein